MQCIELQNKTSEDAKKMPQEYFFWTSEDQRKQITARVLHNSLVWPYPAYVTTRYLQIIVYNEQYVVVSYLIDGPRENANK